MSDMRWADSTDDEGDDFDVEHVSASNGVENAEALQVSTKVRMTTVLEKHVQFLVCTY